MKRKNLFLSIFALLLIACAVIIPAAAYFTANTNADGSIPLFFYRKTEIDEEMQGLNKLVTIKNTGGDHPEYADPVWIRAKAYIGQSYADSDHFNVSGTNWTYKVLDGETEGWWYYDFPVPVYGETTPLLVEVKNLPVNGDHQENDEFYVSSIGVGVIYESTTAIYNEAGDDFLPADWNAKLDAGQSTPSGD